MKRMILFVMISLMLISEIGITMAITNPELIALLQDKDITLIEIDTLKSSDMYSQQFDDPQVKEAYETEREFRVNKINAYLESPSLFDSEDLTNNEQRLVLDDIDYLTTEILSNTYGVQDVDTKVYRLTEIAGGASSEAWEPGRQTPTVQNIVAPSTSTDGDFTTAIEDLLSTMEPIITQQDVERLKSLSTSGLTQVYGPLEIDEVLKKLNSAKTIKDYGPILKANSPLLELNSYEVQLGYNAAKQAELETKAIDYIQHETNLKSLYSLDWAGTNAEYAQYRDDQIRKLASEVREYMTNPKAFESAEPEMKDIIAGNADYLLKNGKNLDPKIKAQLQKLKDIRAMSFTQQGAFDKIYEAARAGRYLADKFGLKPFEWAEKFFASSFGRFITGEPPAGICEQPIRKSGNSDGVLVDSGLLMPILAHVEGERSTTEDPNGKVTYLYSISTGIRAKKTDDSITYNLELYYKNQLLTTIFKQTQTSKGSVSLSGGSALVKESTNLYDKVCLRSSVGSTCNRIADLSEFATVTPIATIPTVGSGGSISGGNIGSSNTGGTSNPYNDW
jgi:hypothetical protein